jgi:MFS family permease
LRSRWSILALLFAVRFTMAFQFESVAAVAPLLGAKFDASLADTSLADTSLADTSLADTSLADIGVLIGLYFTPGVALSLPGGAIGQRFGDKRTTLIGLLLMLIGSLAMGLSDSWSGQMSGRLVAGVGGVRNCAGPARPPLTAR